MYLIETPVTCHYAIMYKILREPAMVTHTLDIKKEIEAIEKASREICKDK